MAKATQTVQYLQSEKQVPLGPACLVVAVFGNGDLQRGDDCCIVDAHGESGNVAARAGIAIDSLQVEQSYNIGSNRSRYDFG
ncbi:MAG: hypothetical protein U0905_01010 [Pirellulales bacterium]